MLYHIYNQDILGLSSSTVTSITCNDFICMQILFGKIIVKPEIVEAAGNKVLFSNNTSLQNVDTIILCTGYKRDFSFLGNDIVTIKHDGKFIPLYKNIFYTKYYKSMAFIGIASINGPSTLMAEMQTRYAAQVFKGVIKLPDQGKMNDEIDKALQNVRDQYGAVKEYNFVSNFFIVFVHFAPSTKISS